MSDPVDRPAPTRHVEQETKLDAEPGFRLPDLAAHPRVRAVGIRSAQEPVTERLDATYFDTERQDLLASRLTLRRRTGGHDAGWHLKLPAGAGARTEVRLPLAAGAPGRVPPELGALVAGAARGRDLRPVARIVTDRTVTTLRSADGTALVEVADDAVTATRPDSPESAARHWREIEVEAAEGAPDPQRVLQAVTDALVAAGARISPVASKLGRALGRQPGAHGDHSPPAAGSGAAVTAGAALLDYLAGQRDLLIAADVRLRDPDPDGEAPHDARAAARRIRSALRVYRPLLAARPGNDLAKRLRRLGAQLSPVRDLDVLRARLAALPAAESPHQPVTERPDGAQPGGPAGSAAMSRAQARVAGRRAAALRTLRGELAGTAYIELLRTLDDLVQRPPFTAAARAPAAEVLPVLVAAAWLQLRADAEVALAEPQDAETVHAVRKDAKTVRYAAQAAVPQVPELAGFAESVTRLQDVLGAHQDSVTALAAIAELVADRELGADAAASGDPDLGAAEREVLERWRSAERLTADATLAQFAELWPGLPVLPVLPVPHVAGPPGDGGGAAVE